VVNELARKSLGGQNRERQQNRVFCRKKNRLQRDSGARTENRCGKIRSSRKTKITEPKMRWANKSKTSDGRKWTRPRNPHRENKSWDRGPRRRRSTDAQGEQKISEESFPHRTTAPRSTANRKHQRRKLEIKTVFFIEIQRRIITDL
jgi:hypothetical protein